MTWQKSPPELVDIFDRVFPNHPLAQRRQMFGYPAGFIEGHMFSGLWRDRLVLRLPDADLRELIDQHAGEAFEPAPGRPMTGFALVPRSMLADEATLEDWIARALAHAAAMPPKKPRAARPRRKRA